jgi:ribosome-binding factor A
MDSTRRARLAAVIQEEIATLVSREVKDPRIPSVTFTRVEVTQDGSHAAIYVAILGGADRDRDGVATNEQAENLAALRMKDCLEGLTSAGGFLRRHLATALTVRHIPNLVFKEDRGFENTNRVHELLKKISDSQPSGSGT